MHLWKLSQRSKYKITLYYVSGLVDECTPTLSTQRFHHTIQAQSYSPHPFAGWTLVKSGDLRDCHSSKQGLYQNNFTTMKFKSKDPANVLLKNSTSCKLEVKLNIWYDLK